MHELVRTLKLAEGIDEHVHIFKKHFPYHESDHVLKLAYNVLAGGTRLDRLLNSGLVKFWHIQRRDLRHRHLLELRQPRFPHVSNRPPRAQFAEIRYEQHAPRHEKKRQAIFFACLGTSIGTR